MKGEVYCSLSAHPKMCPLKTQLNKESSWTFRVVKLFYKSADPAGSPLCSALFHRIIILTAFLFLRVWEWKNKKDLLLIVLYTLDVLILYNF